MILFDELICGHRLKDLNIEKFQENFALRRSGMLKSLTIIT